MGQIVTKGSGSLIRNAFLNELTDALLSYQELIISSFFYAAKGAVTANNLYVRLKQQ